MYLALTLISSILFIIHVQSIPNGCQQGIRSLSSALVQTANDLGNGPLHTRVSNLARKLESFSSQKRNAQNTGVSMGSRDNCLREMNNLYAELMQIAQALKSSKNSNGNADISLNRAITLVQEMMEKRQTL